MSQNSLADAVSAGGMPAGLDLPEAARMLGVGRTLAYQLVREGQWPTPVVRVGRLIKIPTRPCSSFSAPHDSGPPVQSPVPATVGRTWPTPLRTPVPPAPAREAREVVSARCESHRKPTPACW